VVKVSASAGSVKTTEVSVAVQPHTAPTIPPAPQPPPVVPVPQPPDQPLTVTLLVTPGAAGTATTFGVATQAIASATWTFGDNTPPVTTTVPTTTHVYALVQSYAASVTVTDARGRTASDSKVVVVPATLPPAFTVAVSATPT